MSEDVFLIKKMTIKALLNDFDLSACKWKYFSV